MGPCTRLTATPPRGLLRLTLHLTDSARFLTRISHPAFAMTDFASFTSVVLLAAIFGAYA